MPDRTQLSVCPTAALRLIVALPSSRSAMRTGADWPQLKKVFAFKVLRESNTFSQQPYFVLMPSLQPEPYSSIGYKEMTPTWKETEPRPATETSPMSVYVVSLSEDLFEQGLTAARRFIAGLESRLIVLAPRVVPYPLDLDHPPVDPAFSAAKLGEPNVKVILCRDQSIGLLNTLPLRSLVVIGARKRWWNTLWFKTKEESIAERLRSAGHHVLLAWTPEGDKQ
jgi:hypothetical protein